jgi:hypothetical protein
MKGKAGRNEKQQRSKEIIKNEIKSRRMKQRIE